MESLLFPYLLVPVLGWLAVLSVYDLRYRSRPEHPIWMLVPLLLAGLYRFWLGGWVLTLLAFTVLVISEREHLPGKAAAWIRRLCMPAVLILATVCERQLALGFVNISIFWLAWEASASGWLPGAIGGTDALIAITLTLLWPQAGLVVAILLAHLLASLVASCYDLVRHRKLTLHSLPSVPILAGAVVLFVFFLRSV